MGQVAEMWRNQLLCDAIIKTGTTDTKVWNWPQSIRYLWSLSYSHLGVEYLMCQNLVTSAEKIELLKLKLLSVTDLYWQ